MLPWGQPVAAFADTSVQVACAGVASFQVTLYVERYDWYIVAPVLKLLPIEGSPALFASVSVDGAA